MMTIAFAVFPCAAGVLGLSELASWLAYQPEGAMLTACCGWSDRSICDNDVLLVWPG